LVIPSHLSEQPSDGNLFFMSAQRSSEFVDRLLETVADCLTPEVARALVNLPAQPDVQAQIEELAQKCDTGELTPVEQAEYRDIVAAIDVINSLQAKARERLGLAKPEQ
jgi:hypothetical protein